MNHPLFQEQAFLEPAKEITPEADARLRAILRRCSPCTYYAAHQFRATGDLGRIPTIVTGVIARYVPGDLRAKLKSPDDSLSLREDLAIDSLTLMEICTLTEDVLEITLTDEEVRPLCTVGDVMRLIEHKVRRR